MTEPALNDEKEAPLNVEDLKAMDRLAVFLEKTRMADSIMLLQNTKRLLWINFMIGAARGVGIVIGGSVFGVILLFITIKFLRYAFHHVGGLPWVGNELEDGLQWILSIIDKHNKAGH
jgi:hypothetical protein